MKRNLIDLFHFFSFPLRFFSSVFRSINSNAELSPITFFAWDNGPFHNKSETKATIKNRMTNILHAQDNLPLQPTLSVLFSWIQCEHLSWDSICVFYIWQFPNFKTKKCAFAKMIIGIYDSSDSKRKTWAKIWMNGIIIVHYFQFVEMQAKQSIKSFGRHQGLKIQLHPDSWYHLLSEKQSPTNPITNQFFFLFTSSNVAINQIHVQRIYCCVHFHLWQERKKCNESKLAMEYKN